jgi:hypothetical protein
MASLACGLDVDLRLDDACLECELTEGIWIHLICRRQSFRSLDVPSFLPSLDEKT